MTGWRAWYVGGRVFDSRDCAWEDLPDDGVLVVMAYFADGTRQIAQGDDWYWLLPDCIAHNSLSREENERRYPGAALKRGMWAPLSEYEWTVAAAMGSGA